MYALLVQYLVRAGRADEGGQIWVDRGLPRDASALLDLKGQSWRRMEALSCARVMLLAGQGALEEARALVDALCATAWERGMTRTALRGLSLSVAVAHRAGQKERTLSGLVEFLRLTRELDYVRPLVSQGEVGRLLLRGLLDTDPDADLRGAAEAMLPHVGKPDAAASSGSLPASWMCWRKSVRAPEQGDRERPRNYRWWRALSPQEHIPQDRHVPATRRASLCGRAGSSLVGESCPHRLIIHWNRSRRAARSSMSRAHSVLESEPASSFSPHGVLSQGETATWQQAAASRRRTPARAVRTARGEFPTPGRGVRRGRSTGRGQPVRPRPRCGGRDRRG